MSRPTARMQVRGADTYQGRGAGASGRDSRYPSNANVLDLSYFADPAASAGGPPAEAAEPPKRAHSPPLGSPYETGPNSVEDVDIGWSDRLYEMLQDLRQKIAEAEHHIEDLEDQKRDFGAAWTSGMEMILTQQEIHLHNLQESAGRMDRDWTRDLVREHPPKGMLKSVRQYQRLGSKGSRR